MKPTFPLLITAFFCLLINFLSAQPVNINTAKRIAENYLNSINQSKLKSASSNTNRVQFTSVKATVQNNDTLYYILNDTINKGFVIVSADKRTWPILGYSTEGNFDEKKQPDAFNAWMENRKQEIESIKKNNLQPDEKTIDYWNQLSLKNAAIETSSVEPLIKTKWDQGCFYNELCPSDAAGPCGHAFTGCTITAMAQIMKYWNYPTKGTGSHSYTHSTYGNLSADFGATTYQWNQMPNQVTSQNNAVATLMYHCGISLDTDFGPNTSSASSPVDALVRYFNYSSNAMLVYRSGFTTTDWINLLKSELDLRHPIWYSGSGGFVEHAFICDGYQNSDYFHFNWGWGGSSDGYFYIGNLNPGWYSFNENQMILINLIPGSLPNGFNGFLLSSNAVDISEGSAAVDVCSSENWTAVSNQSWLSLSTNSGVAGKTTLTMTATENNTGSDRMAKVTISSPGFSDQFITVNQFTKKNVTPGGLQNLIAKNATSISKLTLTGSIDARDFKTMRDAMPSLTNVDLSEVTIVAYSGTEGPLSPDYINYPSNEIPENAFPIASCRGQNHFKTFILPALITSIGSYSFYNCKFLTSITIPASVTNIGVNTFGGCNALINVDLANPNYSSIDGILFDKNITSLIHCPISKTESYTIPSSVTSIKIFAFESCEKLSGITIPTSVTSIDELAFTACSASIYVDLNNPNYAGIDGVLFNKERTKLVHCPISKTESYIIPSSVVYIERYAFKHCCGLENITIPSSVISIGDFAFFECLALKTVSIPSSVTSIGLSAFNCCKGLVDLTIPLSVARIEMFAFDECVNLRSIHCNTISPINFTPLVTVFRNVNKSTCTLYVPFGSKNAYMSANHWKDFRNIVEIPGIFLSNNNVSMGPEVSSAELVISSSSAWIATSDQTWLTAKPSTGSSGTDTITFTANINPTTTIRSATITVSATGLTPQIIKVAQYGIVEVTAGNLKAILGNQLSTITSLTLSGTIDARDFKIMRDEMPSLTNIDLSRVKIASYCGNEGTIDSNNNFYPSNGVPRFAFCKQNASQVKSGLKSVILPLTTISIGDYAFFDCRDLNNIDIPLFVESIGVLAFFRTGISVINIPASVNNITNSAFSYFNGKITVDENNLTYSAIDGVLFNKNRTELIHCPISKTGEYRIPSSVLSIGQEAFGECDQLTAIRIPSTVISIGSNAFLDCRGLKSIYSYALSPVDLSNSMDVFGNTNKTESILNVPYGSKASYQTANQWQDFKNIVEMPGFNLSSISAYLKSDKGSNGKIEVSSNVECSVSSDKEWLKATIEKVDGKSVVTFEASENSSKDNRSAVITVSANSVESQTIIIIQNGSSITGIDPLNITDLIIYPNPTKGKLKIKSCQIPMSGYQLVVTDINGKIVLRKHMTSLEDCVDLNGNPPGVYFITTDLSDKKSTKVLLLGIK